MLLNFYQSLNLMKMKMSLTILFVMIVKVIAFLNYWGYNPISFFAPKAGYAASGKYFQLQNYEFKNLIKELHKNNIKVILDVVFNHTAEGDERGHIYPLRVLIIKPIIF